MPKPKRSIAWRIIAWNVAIVLVALAAVVMLTDTVRRAEIATAANHDVEQEISQFTEFATAGTNPETGESFSSSQELLESYLRQQVPKTGESMFALVDGQLVRQIVADATPLRQEVVREVQGASQSTGVLELNDAGFAHWGRVSVEAATPAVFAVSLDTSAQHEQVTHQTRLFLLMALGIAAVTGLFAWLSAQRIVRPIRKLSAVTAEISDTNLTRRVPVRGKDEIAQLATRFNDMLDRIDHAYSAQRQFLDDAGHELRTPITVVRGHLELLPSADEEQRERSMELCFSELDRMSRMVNSLITLAKAEKFMERRPTDLSDWFIELEDKAEMLSERRTYVTELPEGEADIDPDRVTEAVLELVSNAVKYTDGPIEISGRVVGDKQLKITVRDEGPGITAEEQKKVFERFHHSGNSSGLGLAIVESIAHSHGGRAWVRSTPPDGATFGLTIPLRKETA